jgi:serine phosphatase RsbU (regulator of sigma subunit)
MAQTVSIRRSLILNIIAMVMLLGGAIMLTMFIGARTAIRDLSGKIIRQTIAQTESKLSSFFDPVTNELLRIKTLGQKGLINLDDFESLRDHLKAVMRQYPQVTSLMVADESDRDFMMLRTDSDEWLIRQMGLRPNQAKITEWTDDPNSPATVTWKEFDYDAHSRPWYKGAVAKWKACQEPNQRENADKLIHWTDPYQFFTTKEYGMTLSTRFETPDGRWLVVGFDILLKDIQTFTDNLKVLSHGQAVILTTEKRLVIGFSATEHYGGQKAENDFMLKQPDELGDFLVDDAIKAIDKRLKHEQTIVGEAIRFKRPDRSRWWVSGDRFPLASDRNLMMAVIVPESDMLENIQHARYLVFAITGVVLMLGVMRSLTLAKRYSQPIESLVAESNRMSTGDLESGKPIVSSVREMHQLADAHEKMRQGLKTLLKLESDIQIARQIQQKTLPQNIPQLAGFDIDGWNAPADETGGDTYDIVGYEIDGETQSVNICNESAEEAILLLADATGHGLGPALSVTQLRAMLRMAVYIQPDISMIAQHMNAQLCADLPEGRFITAWLGKIDTYNHTIRYFSAGQAPLLHYIAGEDKVNVMDADTFPLGIFERLGSTEVKQIDMRPGDIFAVISDGIYEAVDPEDEQLGTDRVIEILKQNRSESAKAISETIRLATDRYTQNAPADDDRTIVIIKRTSQE